MRRTRNQREDLAALLPELPRGLRTYSCDFSIHPDAFAELIRHEGVEVATAFGPDGRMVTRPRQGTATEVDFDGAEPLAGTLVIHCHPEGGAPSSDDLVFAVQRDLAELRIVYPNGTIYRVKRPPDGWPSSDNMEEVSKKANRTLDNHRAERARQGAPPMSIRETQDFLASERTQDLAHLGVRLEKTNLWQSP